MKVLIVGGTGLISTDIVEQLLPRGVHVTLFNRGKREGAGSPRTRSSWVIAAFPLTSKSAWRASASTSSST